MTILLTGARGQLGSDIVQLARHLQLPLIGFDRQQMDISRREQLTPLFDQIRPSLVINAAAYTAVDRAEQEPALAYAVNGEGAGHLAELCREQSIPLLHVSTDYVFSGSKGSPYTEGDPPAPINTYGRSKLDGEERIRHILSRHIILRTSWVFGSQGRNFVKTVLRLSREGKPLRIVSDQLGAPTASRRLAECLLYMAASYLRNGDLPWGSYHFSGRPYVSWHGFAEEIVRQASQLGLIPAASVIPIPTEELQLPAKRPTDSRLSGLRVPAWPHQSPPDWREDLTNLLMLLAQSDASLPSSITYTSPGDRQHHPGKRTAF